MNINKQVSLRGPSASFSNLDLSSAASSLASTSPVARGTLMPLSTMDGKGEAGSEVEQGMLELAVLPISAFVMQSSAAILWFKEE